MHRMRGLKNLPVIWAAAVSLLLGLFALVGCTETEAIPATITVLPTQENLQDLILDGNLEQAAQILRQTLVDDPENASAHYQLGLILSITQPEQAADQLSQAASQDTSFEAGLTKLQDALRQSSTIQDPAYQLTVTGQALSSLEEWFLAQAALERAVDYDPTYAEAWAYLGETRQHTGQENGLEALQTAISLDPESYAANLLMSIYWNRNATPRRALPFLRTALKQDPNNLTLVENLAQTLVDAGMVEAGFDTLQELTDQSPEKPETWMMLARLSVENDIKVEEVGLPAARQAVLLEPEDPAATLMLGRAYLLSENALLAERFFATTLQLDPQMAAPHLYLAIIYLNQDNHQPAKPHLMEALSLAEANGDQAIADQAEKFLKLYFP